MPEAEFIHLPNYHRYSVAEMLERSAWFYRHVNQRRTVRSFSDDVVPIDIIKNCLKAAGTAPSGANLQPWQFVVVSDPALKKLIRAGAEKEEVEFYERRAPKEWLEALAPLGTDPNKEFLEIAPYLIAIFVKSFGYLPDGRKIKHYYATESVGIACGLLITALHHAGLASLTHTPSPMRFLNSILDRPSSERPFLLLSVGYPAEKAQVPNIKRKQLSEIAIFR